MAILASNDFEAGDLSEFVSTTIDGSMTIAALEAAKKLGTYGGRFTGDGVEDQAYGLLTWSDVNDLYVGFHLKVSSGYNHGGAWQAINICHLQEAGGNEFEFRLRGNATGNAWGFQILGFTLATTNSDTNFSTGNWMWIYIHYVRNNGAGGAVIEVNGTEIFSELDNNTSTYDLKRGLFGFHMRQGTPIPANGDYIDMDNIIISDAPFSEPVAAGGIVVLRRRRM